LNRGGEDFLNPIVKKFGPLCQLIETGLGRSELPHASIVFIDLFL
jgi:hypothetical protein